MEQKRLSQKIVELEIWRPLGIIFAILAGLAIIFYFMKNVILKPGFAYGSDVTSFAHTAKYVVDYFKANHVFPPTDMSWYAGFELFHAPPAITYFLGTIYYFCKDILVATRIFHPLSLSILFLAMFWMFKKEGYPTGNAFLAGVLFINMPMVLMTMQSYTKVVSFMFWPLGLYATNKILTEPKNKYIAYLAVSIGMTAYAHPMMAEALALMLCFYALVYAALDHKIVTRRFFLVWLGVFLGVLLGGKYLIPFVAERAGIVAVSSAESIFKMGPQWYKDYVLGYGGYLTIALPLAPIFVLLRRRSPKLTALYITALVALLINIGYNFIHLGSFFPFSQAYYYVWYYVFIFFIAYILAFWVDFSYIKNIFVYGWKILSVAIVIVLAFILANNPHPYYLEIQHNVQMSSLQPDIELAQKIENIPNEGRIYMSHNPFGFAKWTISLFTHKQDIEGHYFGVARINRLISNMADAIHYQYPDYVFNILKHLNTRFFITNNPLKNLEVGGDKVGQKFIDEMPRAGYQYVDEYTYKETGESESLHYLDKPSSYLVPITEKTLIIGDYASTLAAAISAKTPAVQGGSIYFDDYDLEFLQNFDSVVLYGFGFNDRKKAEELAKNYVSSGGNLVIEMFSMKISPLADTPNFLGVSGQAEKITSPIEIEPNNIKGADAHLEPLIFNLPGEIIEKGDNTLGYEPMKDWNYLSYIGLDESLIDSSVDPNFSILGYKNVAGGKVTFVGMNFFYHAFLTHDDNELKFVDSLIDKDNHVDKAEGFASTNEKVDPNKLEFDFQNDHDRYVFVSLAYSEHWRAYLDGAEIKTSLLEDLILVKLPAGSHHLEVRYGSTPVMKFSWIITILTAIFLLAMIVTSKKFYLRGKDKK